MICDLTHITYHGEINLAFDENLISNEFAIKLCLDYEMKKEKKLVKKELIVALRGELYFVKFIINPKEDDFEPGVILGRSFMRLAKGVVDFSNGVTIIYPKPDPFKDDSEKKERAQTIGISYLISILMMCQSLEMNLHRLGGKEELAIRISQKFALLEEKRPVIETMAYNDKYKKILDEIWKDKFELDGKTMKEEEDAVKIIKGEASKEKDDPSAFIFPIRLERKVNENALADTASDINTMPYRIYETLGREEMKKIDRGITMIDHIRRKLWENSLMFFVNILNILEILFSTFDGVCHQTFRAARFDVLRTAESDSDDEEEYVIKRNKSGASIYSPKLAPYLNCTNPEDQSLATQTVNLFWKISVWKKAVSFLGSLPVPLKQANWKPDHKGCYTNEEEETGQWRTEIRLTDPYGNIYLQGFTTKKTDQKLSKYHKLSDIMSPNWFME
nr:hypothetical protein [Tanacetum cinerariifolium]